MQRLPSRAARAGPAGRAAGVATVWIRSGHRDGPHADWTIDSIRDLTALLEDLT